MKFTVLTLTVLSILVVPLMPIGKNSSEVEVWHSSVNQNFNYGSDLYQDYDFRSFSPQWDELITSWFYGFAYTIDIANEFVNNSVNFFRSPFTDPETGVDISKFFTLTSPKYPNAYWDSLTEAQQDFYEQWYEDSLFLITIFYWSPTELNGG